jgi:hypothetical protein
MIPPIGREGKPLFLRLQPDLDQAAGGNVNFSAVSAASHTFLSVWGFGNVIFRQPKGEAGVNASERDRIKLEIREHQRLQRRTDKRVALAFVEACKAGDAERVYNLAEHLGEGTLNGWRQAIRNIAREITEVSPEVRDAFLAYWVQHKGFGIREDHRALRIVARVLMPPYSGPAMRLYRGACIKEWRHRIYGFSWTSNIEVARSFAQNYSYVPGGNLVMETVAPRKAILCAVGAEEDEYIIDRKLLKGLTVVQRYSEEQSAAAS